MMQLKTWSVAVTESTEFSLNAIHCCGFFVIATSLVMLGLKYLICCSKTDIQDLNLDLQNQSPLGRSLAFCCPVENTCLRMSLYFSFFHYDYERPCCGEQTRWLPQSCVRECACEIQKRNFSAFCSHGVGARVAFEELARLWNRELWKSCLFQQRRFDV